MKWLDIIDYLIKDQCFTNNLNKKKNSHKEYFQVILSEIYKQKYSPMILFFSFSYEK
jgi:hypothetical protein